MAFEIENGVLKKYIEEKGITEIVIPDTVKIIDNKAFYCCKNLEEIVIPDSVTSIVSNIFDECHGLKKIKVGKNNKNYCDIDGVLFNKDKTILIRYPINKSESAYEIPYGTEFIGDSAFSDCENLKEIKISDSITSIGDSVFRECVSLKEIIIPNSVTNIGSNAFSECTSLKEIKIPDSVTSIGNCVFRYCGSLEKVTISDSVKSIGYENFDWCINLKKIKVSKDNKNYCDIDGVLFNKDKTILIRYPINKSESVYEIPYGTEFIGDSAFSNCENLKEIIIPNSVTNIGNHVFNNCRNLEEVHVSKNNKNYCDIDGVLFNKDKTILIKYPIGKSKSMYKIPHGTETIDDSAFFLRILKK